MAEAVKLVVDDVTFSEFADALFPSGTPHSIGSILRLHEIESHPALHEIIECHSTGPSCGHAACMLLDKNIMRVVRSVMWHLESNAHVAEVTFALHCMGMKALLEFRLPDFEIVKPDVPPGATERMGFVDDLRLMDPHSAFMRCVTEYSDVMQSHMRSRGNPFYWAEVTCLAVPPPILREMHSPIYARIPQFRAELAAAARQLLARQPV